MVSLRHDGVERTVVGARVIACAGLQADRVAAMTGDGGDERDRALPGRLLHAHARRPPPRAAGSSTRCPIPRFPFLGIHFTKRIDGEVWAGPNAVLAFEREGYRRATDISPRDLAGTLAYPGFLRLATKFWRTGLGRDVARLVQARRSWRDSSGTCPRCAATSSSSGRQGVRAQALARDGSMVDDFPLGDSGST